MFSSSSFPRFWQRVQAAATDLFERSQIHHHPLAPLHLNPLPWQTGSWPPLYPKHSDASGSLHTPNRTADTSPPPGSPFWMPNSREPQVPLYIPILILLSLVDLFFFIHLLFFSPNKNTSSIPWWFMYDSVVTYPQPGEQQDAQLIFVE